MQEKNTKGIVLAAGLGTRLFPSTISISKQLLPVFDKPLIYYPLSVLMLAKIRDILIISQEENIPMFKKLFGDGSRLGLSIDYANQEKPNGIAEAFLIAEDFIEQDNVALVLGDNIFYGNNFSSTLLRVKQCNKPTIFAYEVAKAKKFGVVQFDENKKPISIEEKPEKPKSHFAVTGLYFYDNRVVEIAKRIKPSARQELEITDINVEYMKMGELNVEILGRGFAWLDTGDHSSLLRASQFVQSIEMNQGIKIACLEEIALKNGFISKDELLKKNHFIGSSTYYEYVRRIVEAF